jgi:hypothetical protein
MPQERAVRVVGIDCATDHSKVGIATGGYSDGVLTVTAVALCSKERDAASIAADWMLDCELAIVGIDAPLGWPKPLSDNLISHFAGNSLEADAHSMFRRDTDRRVHLQTGKTPLDVGADRIARTAHAALHMLSGLRNRTGKDIPLAWEPEVECPSAIEVYPAATLCMHALPSRNYKKPDQVAEREVIIKGLARIIELPEDQSLMRQSADALDAVVCLLAVKDFLDGAAASPKEPELAKREGWIWVRCGVPRTNSH